MSDLPPTAPEPATPPVVEPPAPGPALIGEPPAPEASAPAPFVPFEAAIVAEVMPEGFNLDDAQSSKLLEVLNASQGDPKALTAGLMKMYSEELVATQTRIAAEYTALQVRRQAEVQADPTLGGPKLPETLRAANEVVKRYGTTEFVKELGEAGLANSIHFVRFLANVAKAAPLEAKPVNGSPTVSPKSLGQKLFPTATQ